MDLRRWNAAFNVNEALVVYFLILKRLIRAIIQWVRVVHAHATDSPVPHPLLVPAEAHNYRASRFTRIPQL